MDSKQVVGVTLLAAAAVAGAGSVFLDWGTAPGDSSLLYIVSHLSDVMGAAPTVAIAAIAVCVAVVGLVVVTVIAVTAPARSVKAAYTVELVAFLAYAAFVIGYFLLADATRQKDRLPLGGGMWLGLLMVVLAFVAAPLLRGKGEPAVPPGIISAPAAAPKTMRVTGPPTKGPYAEPVEPEPPALPRRVKCPNCKAVVVVPPGARPFCDKCGCGTPPDAPPA
ncbi:MAG: hypothetical protein V4510_11345 [bacterium]